jgi:patatin-related protein
MSPAAEGHSLPRRCEVRLGLVLYGGVSLAIYINGVCQEFFRATKGRGVYRLAKLLTDSDVVVDVLSGTSAGGVNGILLAYALCNNREFSDASILWRRDGGIRQLLRDPLVGSDNRIAVLNGEGYYQNALEEAFRGMSLATPEPGETPSEFSELDLYVTGTDVNGRVYTQFDDAGHAIDVKDYRTVFRLKHRAGRKEPFNPNPGEDIEASARPPELTYKALAKLARLTSCFPGAFDPVKVAHEAPEARSVDAKLQEWGALGKEACFLDGGVLDNKPFSYTLEAIFARTADRAVDRKLFYVDPDPESFAATAGAATPDFIQAVFASLIGIPGYESISDDLRAIGEHNNKVRQYRRMARAATIADTPPEGVPERRQHAKRLYMRSRMVALSDRIVEGLLRKDGRPDLLNARERVAAASLIESFDKVAHSEEVLARYDVDFARRRIYHTVYCIYETLYGPRAKKRQDTTTVAVHRHVFKGAEQAVTTYLNTAQCR